MSYREVIVGETIRFPSKLVTENDKEDGVLNRHLYSIFRSNDVYLGGERTYSFEEDLRDYVRHMGCHLETKSINISINNWTSGTKRTKSLLETSS